MAKMSQSKRLKRGVSGAIRMLLMAAGIKDTKPRKYYFGVLAVMHNEGLIIREWIDTHLREGVEHFFLIDHMSTDDWRDKVADYLEAGLITPIPATGANVDDVRTENAFLALRSCEWLMVVDLDEFTYAREATIVDYLRRLPDDVVQVKVPWLMFGTSGNLEQPASVVQACRRREDLIAQSSTPWRAKSIVRTRRLAALKIHGHLVYGKSVAPWRNAPDVGSGPFIPSSMRVNEPELVLAQNHYYLQSRAQFALKARRDGYPTAGSARKYTEEYFQKMERLTNSVVDDRLYLKYREYFDALAEGRSE